MELNEFRVPQAVATPNLPSLLYLTFFYGTRSSAFAAADSYHLAMDEEAALESLPDNYGIAIGTRTKRKVWSDFAVCD